MKDLSELRTLLKINGITVHGTITEFYGEGELIGLWVDGEDNEAFDTNQHEDTNGVDEEINYKIEKLGFYCEWYDDATCLVYQS